RRRGADQGPVPPSRDQFGDLLPVEVEVRRHGGVRAAAREGTRGRERQAQADVRRAGPRQRCDEGPDREKTVGPAQKREAVRFLLEEHQRPLRRFCDMVGLSRAAWYRPPLDWTVRDAEIISALAELVKDRPSRGFWKCRKLLRRRRPEWNHKRIYRVYKAMGLNRRRAVRRRLPKRERVPLYVPRTPDSVWSADFMSDALACGRRFRTFNVEDDFNREALHIEVDTSISSLRLVRIFQRLQRERGLPQVLRTDNVLTLESSRKYGCKHPQT